MSDENKKTRGQGDNKRGKTKKKKRKISYFRLAIVIFLLLAFIGAGAVGGVVLATVKNAPEIDPRNIYSSLNESSVILDENGNLIEKIQTQEFRTIVELNQIPEHMQNAIIAIEDERFRSHKGVDPRGILGAISDYVKNRGQLRGGSTITQQLVKNVYLTHDRDMGRKIKEAYLSLQLERELTKDQILEAYLNIVYFGQGAYGVQEAAQIYFGKDVWDLTIAESALIAGITKFPYSLTPYILLSPDNVDPEVHHIVGQVDILGVRYTAVFNERPIDRQRTILFKMRELNFITEEEYREALDEDMKEALNPGQKKLSGISSYFTDYVKTQVVNDLVEKAGYTREEAQSMLFTGGLTIYSTMDIDMQHKVEEIYNNFTSILFGDVSKRESPVLIEWRRRSGGKGNLDAKDNLVDDAGRILFYKRSNLLDDNSNLIIEKGTYNLDDNGNLIIKSNKLNLYPKTIDVQDFYTIDNNKNLVTHTVGSLDIGMDNYEVDKQNQLIISSNFLSKSTDFYKIDDKENLLINPKYFFSDERGIVQPQSATVIIDHNTGKLRALVGGRDIEGYRLFNRAQSARQPGSAIKPLAVYLPALDNGYTAASILDDVPFYDERGNRWPRNWDNDYWGLGTIRLAVEQSRNVSSVKMVDTIGRDLSMEYLSRLGIIKNNGKNNFVTRKDNARVNDENLSALGLGGMSRGLSPMEMTAAYGAIANKGVHTEPIAYTKVLDRNGKVILETKPVKTSVVTPEVAYIMTDILRTTVTNGTGGRARIKNHPTAGKTGTTQGNGDAWFVGFSPHYTTSVWIGNDINTIKLSQGSAMAATYWSRIMNEIHKDLEVRNFEMPQGLVTRQICNISGKLATDLCQRHPGGSTVRTEMFVRGTEPTDFCDVHVEVAIDTSTGKLATEYCPEHLVEMRVFIQRPIPYNPADHDGIVPRDYKYTVPTEECDQHQDSNPFKDWWDNMFGNNKDKNRNQSDDDENENEDYDDDYDDYYDDDDDDDN